MLRSMSFLHCHSTMWEPDIHPRLTRPFYARSALLVAPDLLGCTLVKREADGTVIAGMVVETEAYTWDDPACHAYRGETPRCRVMFGETGCAYLYFTYGMHHCFNVVTSEPGRGEAVLIRAVQPVAGECVMRERRAKAAIGASTQLPAHYLCGGPARLCQAFAFDLSTNGTSLVGDSRLWLEARPPEFSVPIVSTPRIGISRAKENYWRFVFADSRFVSRSVQKP